LTGVWVFDIIIKGVYVIMDKISRFALLLDFYGGLLTEKQRTIMSYHYEEDMSLAEIADEFDVSRQAAHDIIKRSEKILSDYEDELGIVKKFITQKEKLKEVKALIDNNESDNIKKALSIIDELIEI
jgi:predicted DNA-binding protein YlxM (UPF0122 family)